MNLFNFILHYFFYYRDWILHIYDKTMLFHFHYISGNIHPKYPNNFYDTMMNNYHIESLLDFLIFYRICIPGYNTLILVNHHHLLNYCFLPSFFLLSFFSSREYINRINKYSNFDFFLCFFIFFFYSGL